ncbi:MAG: transcriptional repressor [Verrucomicrobia bacterium]|nr:transcriptional repressor [Verrucomicrobiota bacterium]
MSKRPLTAAEVHELAVKEMPTLGVRTVFRRLSEWVREGRVVRVDYPGQPPLYEIVAGQHHPHFICRDCQRVYDLDMEVADVPVINPPPGFLIDGQETIFYGVCPACLTATSAPATGT